MAWGVACCGSIRDREGHVAGYAWSVLQVSKFQSQSAHNMVIGRIDPDFIRSLKTVGR